MSDSKTREALGKLDDIMQEENKSLYNFSAPQAEEKDLDLAKKNIDDGEILDLRNNVNEEETNYIPDNFAEENIEKEESFFPNKDDRMFDDLEDFDDDKDDILENISNNQASIPNDKKEDFDFDIEKLIKDMNYSTAPEYDELNKNDGSDNEWEQEIRKEIFPEKAQDKTLDLDEDFGLSPQKNIPSQTKTLINNIKESINFPAENNDSNHDNSSIESLVQKAIRPMLKKWIDKNLESLVREELKKMM